MSSKPRILVMMPDRVYSYVISAEGEKTLNGFANVVRAAPWEHMSDEESAGLFTGIDGVLTSWGIHPFPSEAFLASDSVKILSHAAGGVTWVPRQALEKGIVVTNASEVMSVRVSEMCMTYALMGLHNMIEFVDRSRRVREPDPFRRRRLYGKTIGMVGFGWIARNFSKFLAPFDVRILAYDPYVSDEMMEAHGAGRATLQEIFSQSQVVSIHAGSTDETHKMIGADLLSMVQDDAVFLNTSRGAVVDHDALTAELRKRRFVAYLDVTDPEPLPAGHELLSMPNVVVTPHIGGGTSEPIPEVGMQRLRIPRRYFAGEPLLHEVKLEWYDRMT